MTINRHNYEEYFLLYADNELPEEDRKAVEIFASENEDLAHELELLKSLRLEGDNSFFAQKEILYKRENGISLANYQEYFFLAIDNELSKKEVDEVEKFILKHPELQEEFIILKQTVLQAEPISFAGKETLYRSEKKERRLLPPVWMKLSIAAAILGLIATSWLLTTDKNVETPQVLTAKNSQKPEVKIHAQPALAQPGKETPLVAGTVNSTNKNEPKVAAIALNRDRKPSAKNGDETTSKVNQPEEVIPNKNQEKTVIDKVTVNNKLSQEPGVTEKNSVENLAMADNKPEEKVNTELVTHVSTNEQTVPVKNAVYREIDTDDQEKSFYLGSAEINKNKLKGLLRKAVGLFDKKANRKDNEEQ